VNGAERTIPAPARPHNDVRQGFVYERVPHITLKSIANNPDIHEGMSRAEIDAAIAKHADVELLFDRPYEDKKKVRVSGRFTVESLSPHRSASFDPEEARGTQAGFAGAASRLTALPDETEAPESADTARTAGSSFEQTILSNLETAGIQNGRRKERLLFDQIDAHAGALIQAIGTTAGDDPQRVAVSIGPEYGTVDARMVKAAAREAMRTSGIDLLVVLGYAFEANALSGVADTQGPDFARDAPEGNAPGPRAVDFANVAAEHKLGNLPVLLVRMNADLAMGDELLKNTAAANLFTVFGEPDIDVRVNGEGDDARVTVEIKGIDVYDPSTGEVRSRAASDADGIALWMIDTDYDEESFFVRHAYFSGGQDPYKRLRTSLKAEIDEAAWESLYSTTSRPFPIPETGKIAVKAINYYGDEVLVVRDIRLKD
jgi:adenine-specific DNA-methyltransferase